MAPANDFPQGDVYPPPAQNPYPPTTAEPTFYPPIPTGDPGLPPPGPAFPYTVPGYPANPYHNTPYPPAGAAGAPPYPPACGAPPYPPGPVGGTLYSTAPDGAAPPNYAGQNPHPVYPPA